MLSLFLAPSIVSFTVCIGILLLFSLSVCPYHLNLRKYKVIHKPLWDCQPLRYGSRDGHAEGEHVNWERHSKFPRDSLPIDMLLSAVSVLVVPQSSSGFPEGLVNYSVHHPSVRKTAKDKFDSQNSLSPSEGGSRSGSSRSHTLYLLAYEEGTDRAFRNVGI
jgi:hypothetical protein